MENERITLYEAVKNSAEKYPQRTALYYMATKISYCRLLKDVDAVAGWLEEHGVKKEEPVTICMPNLPQTVVCFYAINKIGAIAHMVHPLAPPIQLQDYMKKVDSKTLIIPDVFAAEHNALLSSGIRTLLCSPAYYLGKIKNALFSLKNAGKTKAINKSGGNVFYYADAVKHAPTDTLLQDVEKTCVYLHSGGTSGEPKTICLSSAAINSLCAHSLEILCEPDFNGGSMLAVLPMFHGFGLAMGVHAMLCFGGSDTLMPKFRTMKTIKLIKRNEINYIIGVPTLFEALLRRKEFSGKLLKNLRVAYVGGDFVPTKLVVDFNKRMEESGSNARLYEGYGLTETVTVCTVNTANGNKTGSVGKPVGGVEMAAFDGSKKLAANQQGILCISGAQLMNGYLGDAQATNDVFFEHDGKQWIKSGDVGYVDDDGFVYFKSRLKRIAKVSGITIFPSEIENLCMNEIDEVKEAHAIATPDSDRGSAIVLFVCTKAEIEGTEHDKLSDKLLTLIEANLSVYARPKQIFYLRELPKTLVGKVDTNKLKQIYL